MRRMIPFGLAHGKCKILRMSDRLYRLCIEFLHEMVILEGASRDSLWSNEMSNRSTRQGGEEERVKRETGQGVHGESSYRMEKENDGLLVLHYHAGGGNEVREVLKVLDKELQESKPGKLGLIFCINNEFRMMREIISVIGMIPKETHIVGVLSDRCAGKVSPEMNPWRTVNVWVHAERTFSLVKRRMTPDGDYEYRVILLRQAGQLFSETAIEFKDEICHRDGFAGDSGIVLTNNGGEESSAFCLIVNAEKRKVIRHEMTEGLLRHLGVEMQCSSSYVLPTNGCMNRKARRWHRNEWEQSEETVTLQLERQRAPGYSPEIMWEYDRSRDRSYLRHFVEQGRSEYGGRQFVPEIVNDEGSHCNELPISRGTY